MRPPDGELAPAALHLIIRRRIELWSHRDDPDVARLVAEIRHRHGKRLAAVLLYGSYLRGKRDTLLDFYVLLTELRDALPPLAAWGNRLLPPNVYHLSLPETASSPALRAKYATLTVGQFQRAMDDFHSYFWSRFTQPAGLVAACDEDTRRRVTDALARAVSRFAREVAPTLPGRYTSAHFWQAGLALTYASELRSEDPAGVDSLYRHHAPHFDDLLDAYAATAGAAVIGHRDGTFTTATTSGQRRNQIRWAARRVQGKVLSVLRLVKAAATFEDPLDYLLWKIHRHSGIFITPSERQRRHPLIFAWPLLWRLYRRGAFR